MKQRKISALLYTAAATLLASNLVSADTLPKTVPTPADNPTTTEKVELGKQLFFDPRLSVDGTVSCNSCHDITSSGTDNRATSAGIGGQHGGRSAPTVWNAAFHSALFWDGRAGTLEEQAKGPPIDPLKMGMPSEAAIVERLNSIPGYVEQFKTVFGISNAVSYNNMAKAIAAFERTLITPNSPYDRYLAGDKSALPKQAQRGKHVFERTGCKGCHSGANFAGPTLPIGQGFYQKFPTYSSKYDTKYDLNSDKGRYDITKAKTDMNKWRVPSLRNIALTAPYFHNGSVKSLDEAVRVMAKTQLDIKLSEREVTDVVAFLQSLNGELPEISIPRLPEAKKSSVTGDLK